MINLHLFVDEKVISQAIRNFEYVLPKQNRYIVLVPNLDYHFQHVVVKDVEITKAVYESSDFYEKIGDLRQYKHVIIHLLTWNMFQFVSKHPEGSYMWIAWGTDIYQELLEYRGYQLYYDKNDILRYYGQKSLIKDIWQMTLGGYFSSRRMKTKIEALKNISYFAGCSEDYKLLQKYFPEGHNIKHVPYEYYPVDSMINNEMINSRVVGRNIIVGNSAYGHGNHVEVFKLLKSVNLTDRKVIVPLSYGDATDYVINKGKAILGDSFFPITTFMPLAEYNKLLLSANIFIYGNYRQAAVGNIVCALYVGGMVFLNKKNPLYTMYKDMGITLFALEELEQKMEERLTDEEISSNREIVLENYSYDRIIGYIKHYFS